MSLTFIRESRLFKWVLFISMFIFVFMPCITYADTAVYIGGTGTSVSSKDSVNVKSSENYLKIANEINSHSHSMAEGRLTDTQSTPISPNTSYASGGEGVGISVNPQTGQLAINLGGALGINNSAPIYDSTDNVRIYGMPQDWTISIPYIVNYPYGSGNQRLFGYSGSSMPLSSTYYNLDGFYSGLLDDSSESSQLKYVPSTGGYQISNCDGTVMNFDEGGKLTSTQGTFANEKTTYTYADNDSAIAPSNTYLTGITDMYGTQTTISTTRNANNDTVIKVNDSIGTRIYDFNYENPLQHIITMTAENGQKVVITESFNEPNQTGNHTVTVLYPSGNSTVYKFLPLISYQSAPPSQGGTFDAVSEVDSYSDSNQSNLIGMTTYTYSTNNGHNFAGNGLALCYYTNTQDALIENPNAASYRYTTTIQTTYSDSTDTYSENITYDNQNLVTETDSFVNGTPLKTVKYHYIGEDNYGNFEYYQHYQSTYNLPDTVYTTDYGFDATGNTLVQNSAEAYTYNSFGQVLTESYYQGATQGSTLSNPLSVSTMTYATKYSNGSYSGNGLLLSETDVDNTTGVATTITNTTDSSGTYISSTTESRGSQSAVTNYTYDNYGRLTETDSSSTNYPNGAAKTTYTYTISGNNINVTSTDYLNGDKNSTSVSSTSVYDIRNGNPISTTDNMGNEITYSYSNNYQTDTVTMYDASNVEQTSSVIDNSVQNQSSVSYSNGYKTLTMYNTLGEAVNYYDNMTSAGYGKSCTRLLGTSAYNDMGETVSSTDMYGHETFFSYDSYGRNTSNVDWQGNKSAFAYWDTPYSVYNGNVNMNIPVVENSLDGIKISDNYYGPSGNVLKNINYPDNTSNTSVYDLAGNMLSKNAYDTALSSSTASGTSSSAMVTSNLTYDLFGKNSYNMTTQDGFNATSTWTKDFYGNELQRTTTYSSVSPGVNAPGVSPKTPTAITGELSAYNSFGELTSLTDQAGNKLDSFTYYPYGELKSTTDYNGNTYNYTYAFIAGSWEITKLTLTPLKGAAVTKSYTYYDSDYTAADYGELESVTLTRADGSVSTDSYTYYAGGTPYAGSLETETKDGKTMTFNYELLSSVSPNAPSADTVPILSSITDYAGVTTSYTYYSDAPYGRVKEISNAYGSVTYSYFTGMTGTIGNSEYVYTSNPFLSGNSTVAKEAFGNGMSINYQYYDTTDGTSSNNAAELESVTTSDPSGNSVASSVYTYSQGKVASIVNSSSIDSSTDSNNTTIYTYNDLNELTNSTVNDSLGNTVRSIDYTYDLSGNISTKTDTVDGTNVTTVDNYTYTYNAINQLTEMSDIQSVTTINPSTKQSTTLKNTVLDNSYVYDPNGNMLSVTDNLTTPKSTVYTMTYNMENQMVRLINGSNNVDMSYTYGADGSRFSKYLTEDTTEEIQYYGDNEFNTKTGNVSSELAGVVRTVLSGPVTSVTAPSVVESQYLVSDGKSITATTDSTGKITNKYDYTPYGISTSFGPVSSIFNAKNLISTPDLLSLNDNPYQYDGYYNDEGTGLYYDNARYYMPEIGRFTSKDSYDLPNRYAYCDGDPVNETDPTGHIGNFYMNDTGADINAEDAYSNPLTPYIQKLPKWAQYTISIATMSGFTAPSVGLGIAADQTTGETSRDLGLASEISGGVGAMVSFIGSAGIGINFSLGDAGELGNIGKVGEADANLPKYANTSGKPGLNGGGGNTEPCCFCCTKKVPINLENDLVNPGFKGDDKITLSYNNVWRVGKDGILTNEPEVISTPRGSSGYASLKFDEEDPYEDDVNQNVVQPKNQNASFGDGDGEDASQDPIALARQNNEFLMKKGITLTNLFSIPKDEPYVQEDVPPPDDPQIIRNIEDEQRGVPLQQKNVLSNVEQEKRLDRLISYRQVAYNKNLPFFEANTLLNNYVNGNITFDQLMEQENDMLKQLNGL